MTFPWHYEVFVLVHGPRPNQTKAWDNYDRANYWPWPRLNKIKTASNCYFYFLGKQNHLLFYYISVFVVLYMTPNCIFDYEVRSKLGVVAPSIHRHFSIIEYLIGAATFWTWLLIYIRHVFCGYISKCFSWNQKKREKKKG